MVGVMVIVTAFALWTDSAIASLFLVDAWPTPADAGLLELGLVGDTAYEVEMAIVLVALAVATLGSLAHVTGRALAQAPRPLARREVLTVLALWIAAATAWSWTMRSRLWAIADAPVLARRGSATVIVDPSPIPGLHFMLAEPDCESGFAREHSSRFQDVVPGEYCVCAVIQHGGWRTPWMARRQACVQIHVAPGENRVELPADDSIGAPVAPTLQRGWEHDRPFKRLLFFRHTAITLAEALSPMSTDELERSSTRRAPVPSR
jgi:hypothetical protein